MRKFKKIILIMILILMIFSINEFASFEINTKNVEENSQSSEIDLNDPLSQGRRVATDKPDDGIMTISVHTEDISSIISKFEDGTKAVGIDVSAWQEDIDWQQVANSGVKFAILRCCYRGTTDGKLYEDKYFKKNIEGAINNGIYVGVYCYSAALNEDEAIEEANMTLDLIKGYDIKYFVAYDYEEWEPKGHRTDNLSLEQINKNGEAFLSKIRENGYTATLYGSAYYVNNSWDSKITSNNDVWVAHYYQAKPNCEKYNIWQYSDQGQVPGIKGNVDIDVDNTYYFIHNNIDISPYMFNSTYYSDCYPDLKAAFGYNEDLLRNHFESCGKKEGRTGSPIFDPVYYMNKYPDIKNAFGNDYVAAYNHFVMFGAIEGRQGSKYADSNYYLKTYNDLLRTFYSSKTKALAHFMDCGINEERQGSSEFFSVDYKNSTTPYYRKHLGNDYMKYMALDNGGKPIIDNNIDISVYMFDPKYYYDKYEDLRTVIGWDEEALRQHFEDFGKKEGRQGSIIFDPVYYLNEYQDIKNSFGNDYVSAYNHFVMFGAVEGRSGSEELQVGKYLDNYIDLQETFGSYYTKAIQHYILFGKNEGRKGN